MAADDNKIPSNSLKKSLIFTHDKLVPLIICVTGSTFQVSTLFALYFSWPTATLIDLYRPTKIYLPSISLCFIYKINESEIIQTLEARNQTDYGLKASSYDLTLNELNLLTPTIDDYIVSCKVANASIDVNELFNTVDCADAAPVQISLSPILKCFTFFAYMKPQYLYNRDDFYDDSFLKIRINNTRPIDAATLVFVHDNDEEVTFTNGSPEMTLLDLNLYNDFTMTYYTKLTSQLPAPYSKCVNHFQAYGSSKQNLIKRCMYNEIYRNNSAYHHRSLISITSNVTNVTFDRDIPIASYRSYCETEYYHEECDHRLFEVKTVHAKIETSQEPTLVKIDFAFPLGLQSNVTMVKKLNDIEFFCYVASIISLWLEVSMLTVARFLFHHVRKLVRNLLRKKAIEKKRSQLARNQRKNKMKKIKVSNGKLTRLSIIPNLYDFNGLQSFYPRYTRSFAPRYPVSIYYN